MRTWWIVLAALALLLMATAAGQGQSPAGNVELEIGRAHFDHATQRTYTEVAVINRSDKALPSPVRVVLDSISELGVRMIDADGRTSTGKPYLDLVDADGDGILAPGERTRSRRVNFDNPARLRFRFASRIADVEDATVVAAVPPPRRERVTEPGTPDRRPIEPETTTEPDTAEPSASEETPAVAPVQDAGETTAEAPEIAEADEADQPEADAPPQTDIATETDEDEATETDAVAEAEPAPPTVPDSTPTTDEATAPAPVGDGRPYLVGRVLDAGSGQPLPDVAVRLTLAGGEALETPQSATSDPRGRYHFDVPGGAAQVELSRAGYLPATRRLEVPADRVIRAIDARLVKLSEPQNVDPRLAATLTAADGRLRFTVLPATFAETVPLSLTALDIQALPATLPAGWSPLAAAHVGAPAGLTPAEAFELSFGGSPSGTVFAAAWDRVASAWVRVASTATADATLVQSDRLTTFVLVRPDPAPRAPSIPEPDEVLVAVSLPPLPASASADVKATPEAVMLRPGSRTDVTVVLAADEPLSSGTSVELDLKELYLATDGGAVDPEPLHQDVVLHRTGDTLTGRISLTPLMGLPAGELRDAAITVAAQARDTAPGRAVIGASGGSVVSPQGDVLSFPEGALDTTVPVAIRRLEDLRLGLSSSTASILAGFDVDLAGLAPTAALALSVAVEPTSEDNATLLIRPEMLGGRTVYVPVGVMGTEDGRVVTAAPPASLELPGILTEGRYYVVRLPGQIGFVTGHVLDSAGAAVPAMVRADESGLVSITDESRARFVLPVSVGEAAVVARAQSGGLVGQASVVIASAGAVGEVDVTLQAQRPEVLSMTPADGAGAVPVASTISLVFTQPLDPATVDEASLRVLVGDQAVDGSVDLLPDGETLVFRPLRRLVDGVEHRVVLSAALRDRAGSAVVGNQPDGSWQARFTTIDTTPPPPPEPGQIAVGTPNDDGEAVVTATQGTVPPGMTVAVRNTVTDILVTVIADDDGSFSLRVRAGLVDDLELIVVDAAGNETVTPIGRVTPPPGVGVLDQRGGLVEAEDGSAALIPPGVLPPDTIIRSLPISTEDMPKPFTEDLKGQVLGAVSFDFGDSEIVDPLELSFAVQGLPAYDATDRVPLLRIEREITVPDDREPGSELRFNLVGRDVEGRRTELSVALPIVADPDRTPRTERGDGSPSLSLVLPKQAKPGDVVKVLAGADPPYIKLRVPAPETLTGDEQFMLFEVTEVGGKPFWNLLDRADLLTLEDGRQVVQTSSPPYRGIRKDTSRLVVAMFAQASFSYATALHNVTSMPADAGDAIVAVANTTQAIGDIPALGVRFANRLNAMTAPDRSLYEFSVIPVRAGVPGTIQVFDGDTNREIYNEDVDALVPDSLGSVLVIGEDNNDLMVTGTTSQANNAVPIDAAIGISFSHLIDTATVARDTLYIEDAAGHQVDCEISFQDEEGDRNFIVTVKPTRPLQHGQRYKLVATTGIGRPGSDGQAGRTLTENFELPFTTAPHPAVVGKLEIPWVKTFDVVRDKVLLTQRHIPDGFNSLIAVDAADPADPAIVGETKFDVKRDGPLWAVKTLPDAAFEDRNGLVVSGDMALVTAGNSGTFSSLRAFNVDDVKAPKWLATALVSVPLDVIHESAKLLVTPVYDYAAGTLVDFEVQEAFSASLAGIPKTTAIPYVIDTDGARTAYFVNQGIGLMTVDLGRSMPPGPVSQRGDKFGPSYIPTDKAGAVVVRDDGSLLKTGESFTVVRPEHLSLGGATADVYGNIVDDRVATILVNGFRAEIQRNDDGNPIAYDVDVPLREGANAIHLTAFSAAGETLDSAKLMVLRNFESNPLAGPGTVQISLPPLQATQAETIEVQARVDRVGFFDELLVNGISASRKRCPPYVNQKSRACGWDGAGTVAVPLKPGVNSIVASAIDVDEEFPQGFSFADLRVSEGLALAVKDDLHIFDATGLVKIGEVKIGQAFRVSLARGITIDRDDDGRTGFEENEDLDDITVLDERLNLAIVGEGRNNRLSFVDITEPHKAELIGWMPTASPTYRAVQLPGEDRALVAAGDAVLIVDLSLAHHEGEVDRNADGIDDRLIDRIPLDGAHDIRLDAEKGLAYVLQRDIGVAILSITACAQDVGVDVSHKPVERVVRYATLETERAGLFQGIRDGLATAACAPFKVNESAALLSQGSSACIWRKDAKCSTAYQPGLSDYDFEFIVADAQIPQAKQCAVAIEDAIHEVEGLEHADVSVFPVRRSMIDTAYRNVAPVAGSCGAGDDPYGDLCLGRNGLILKWLLEGEWVRDGDELYSNGIDLEQVLDKLREPLRAPVGNVVDPDSIRIDPDNGQPVAVLKEGAPDEPSHIPRLEAREWACLEDFALNQSGARIRIAGAGLGEAPIHSHYYLKRIHKAAKAGIRAFYGKLLGSERGNRLIVATSRGDYNSQDGCLTAHDKPDEVTSVDEFSLKRCESFEEYIASRGLVSVRDGLGLVTEEEALLGYEMFRRKSDVGSQIADEATANKFIVDVMRFIRKMQDDTALQAFYDESVKGFTDGVSRAKSLGECSSKHLKDFRAEDGAAKLKLKIPGRIYNGGFVGLTGIDLTLHHDGAEAVSQSMQLAPGESRFFEKAFTVKPKLKGVHKLQFSVDGEDRFAEYDEANNVDGLHYYILYPEGGGAPPQTPAPRPDPVKPIPDPPAAKMCLIDGKAPPAPRLELTVTVNGQSETAVETGAEVDLEWILRNRGNVPVSGLVIRNSLIGTLDAGSVAPGETVTHNKKYTVPKSSKPLLALSTVMGMDPDGNAVGPLSGAVKITVVGKPAGKPVIRILSPRRQDPPFSTSEPKVAVSGIVLSRNGLSKVTVQDNVTQVQRVAEITKQAAAPSWGPTFRYYTFRTKSGDEVPLSVGVESKIVAVATDEADNKAADLTVAERTDLDAVAGLSISKRVNGKLSDRAMPGDKVRYTVEVKNTSGHPIDAVVVEDPLIPDGVIDKAFPLAPNQSRKIEYDYTVPDKADSQRIINTAVAQGFNGLLPADWTGPGKEGERKPAVGPVEASAELLVGNLICEPRYLLLRGTQPVEGEKVEPVRRQLHATFLDRLDDGTPMQTDVTKHGQLKWVVKSEELKGKAGIAALRWLTEKLLTKEGEKPKELIKVADVSVDGNGLLTAKNNGVNVVQAVFKHRDRTYVCTTFVIVGIVGIESIELEPRSLLTGGILAGKYLTNLLAEKYLSREVWTTNPPMILGTGGPLACSNRVAAGLTNWIGSAGYGEMVSMKFRFQGPSDYLALEGVDLLQGAEDVIQAAGGAVGTALTGVSAAGYPIGFVLKHLFQHAATQLLVTFHETADDSPVSVSQRIYSGIVTAQRPGCERVKGTVDLTKYRMGKASDDFLVLVGPNLRETQVRVDPTVMKPNEQRNVETHMRIGLTPPKTPAAGAAPATGVEREEGPGSAPPVCRIKLGKTKDLIAKVAGDKELGDEYAIALKYLDRLIPGGVPRTALTKKIPFEVADNPRRLGMYPLSFELAPAINVDELWLDINVFEFGFPAPNAVADYARLLRDDGSRDDEQSPQVARMMALGETVTAQYAELLFKQFGIERERTYRRKLFDVLATFQDRIFVGPLRRFDPTSFMRYVTYTRAIEGLNPGQVHLGVEACLPFVNPDDREVSPRDLYDPSIKLGGATIRVTAEPPPDDEEEEEDKDPTCADVEKLTVVHMGESASIPLVGAPKEVTFEPAGGPSSGTLSGLPASPGTGQHTVTYQAPKGVDPEVVTFHFRTVLGDKKSRNCYADILVANETPVATSRDHPLSKRNEPVASEFTASDPDGVDELSIRLISGPANGAIDPPLGTGWTKIGKTVAVPFSYIPARDFGGDDRVVFEVTDGAATDIGVIDFHINRPPTCENRSLAAPLRRDSLASLQARASDEDGQPLDIRIIGGPAHGRVEAPELNKAAGLLSFGYRPETGYAGADQITFEADDGFERVTCTIDMLINEPPVAISKRIVVQKNSPGDAVDLEARDGPGEQLTFEVPSASEQGGVVTGLQSVGLQQAVVTYVPAPGYAGPDAFAFTVRDAMEPGAAPGVIDIKVNAPPFAIDDEAVTDESVPVVIDVLANDSDPDGVVLAVIDVTDSPYGTVEILPAEPSERTKVRFSPKPGAVGTFLFHYVNLDDDGGQSVGRVEVTVKPVNTAPVAADDAVATDEGVAVRIDVLANDSDPEGDVLSVASFTRASHGTLTNLANAIRYTPEPGYSGEDAFTYEIDDGAGGRASASVVITVQPRNDPPTLPDVLTAQPCCLPRTIDVLGEASDVDGEVDPATLSVVRPPRNGSVEIDPASGKLRYTPRYLFQGVDDFQVTVADEVGAVSPPATVKVVVLTGFINEVAPGEGKVELYNPGVPDLDLRGWQVAGYALGSDPARETYSIGLPGTATPTVQSFGPGALLVIDLPGVDLTGAPLVMRDPRGTKRDELDPTKACFQEQATTDGSLSRRSDGYALANPCTAFRWADATSLGTMNP